MCICYDVDDSNEKLGINANVFTIIYCCNSPKNYVCLSYFYFFFWKNNSHLKKL